MPITEEKIPGAYILRCDSWGEWLERAKNAPTTCTNRTSRKTDRYQLDWTGTANFAQALTLARDGWKDGEQHVNRMSMPLFDMVSTMIERPYIIMDTEGQDIDIAAYLDGEPECWQRTETRVSEGSGRRIFQLVYCGTVSAGIDTNVIIARGAALVALVQLLEYAGHGVEAILAFSVSNSNAKSEQYVTIKSADQPVDTARLAFAFAHPSSFRRIAFSVQETLDETQRRMFGFGNYGMYGFPPFEALSQGDIYIGGASLYDAQWQTPESAQAWIIGQLQKQGITLKQMDKE